MSEPIQSISQGNYILATQQEVSHDNTLSGNGTVDSPLGLNETVLWEGDMFLSANSTFTANDSFLNYEQINFYIFEHPEVGDVHIDSHKGGTLTTGNKQRYDLFCPGLPEGASATIRFNHAVVTGDNNSSIYKVNAAGQNSIETTALVKATCPSKLIKIVGINRKAQ